MENNVNKDYIDLEVPRKCKYSKTNFEDDPHIKIKSQTNFGKIMYTRSIGDLREINLWKMIFRTSGTKVSTLLLNDRDYNMSLSILPEFLIIFNPGGTKVQTDEFNRNSYQNIYKSILECIGNTPLIKLNQIPKSMGIQCEVLVKCEFFNPGGSLKDRMAQAMIESAENCGVLKPGSTLIEVTSGNTGIGFTIVGRAKGYETLLVLQGKSSVEKENILKALGAKTVRVNDSTPPTEPGGLLAKPIEIQKEIPNSVLLNQFSNYANPLGHYYTTGVEIVEQCDGKVDMVVMGVGTGGTLTGVGRKVKELVPGCVIVGADPYGSTIAEPPTINETKGAFVEIEGIGHIFYPQALDKTVVDYWVKVKDGDSFRMARRLHKEEGILCGGSSGTILCGALEAAKSLKKGQRCVVVLPDGIGNYLTKFVSDYWMEIKNHIPCRNAHNHWWWDLKVSLLNPKSDLYATTSTTYQGAVDIMKSNSRNVLPVVDDKMNLKGMVTLRKLTTLLLSSPLNFDHTITTEELVQCVTVTPTSIFGILSRILEHEQVAIVVEEKEPNTGNQKLIGVLFPTDFLQYISQHAP